MTFFTNKHTSFYILLTALIIFLFARYAFQYDVPRYALTIVVMAMALLGDQDEILAALMCCIPLHNAVNFSITLIVCATIYVLKSIRNFSFGFSSVLILLMVIYELLHAFLGYFQPLLFFADMAPLFVLLAIMRVDLKKIDYAFIVRTMAIILASLCMTLLVNFIISAGGDLVSAVSSIKRIGVVNTDETLYGTGVHPNTLGIINVLAIAALLQLRFIGRNINFDSVLVVFLLMFGMLTSSRTFLACFLFMTSLFIIGQVGGLKRKIIIFAKMTLLIVFVLFAMSVMFPETLEYYAMRFSSTDITTITTGRDILMYDYYYYLVSNMNVMFFGVGLNDFTEKVINVYNMSTHTPHNSIQEIVVAWGILGIIMVTLLFVAMVMESKWSDYQKVVINYIPMFIILLKSMAGKLLTVGYTMLALSFAYLSLCQDFSERDYRN